MDNLWITKQIIIDKYKNMYNAFKGYNWQKLLSDLMVALMATGLTFLLNRLNSLNLPAGGAEASGVVAFIINKARHSVWC